MKTRLTVTMLGVTIMTLPSLSAEITLESLLDEMTDYAAVARWPQPEFTWKQASSYDRGTVAPDKPGWFANNDQNQFIRTEENQGRKERLMMDADGPGCIVRFWLTTDRNKKGTLRFYLDGAAEPALAFPAFDLLSGDLRIGPPLVQPHPGYLPDANGGNNLYSHSATSATATPTSRAPTSRCWPWPSSTSPTTTQRTTPTAARWTTRRSGGTSP